MKQSRVERREMILSGVEENEMEWLVMEWCKQKLNFVERKEMETS